MRNAILTIVTLALAAPASAETLTLIRFDGDIAAVTWKTNGAGQAVGASVRPDGTYRAYLYTQGRMVDLTPPGATIAMSNEINSRGQVAFLADASDGTFGCYLFTPDVANGATGKTTPIVQGVSNVICSNLNDAGEVIGIAQDSDFNSRGFLWTHGLLVWLPRALTNSVPTGLNEYGQISGQFTASDGTPHAFLWTPLLRNGIFGVWIDLGVTTGDSFILNPLYGRSLNQLGQVMFTAPTSAGTPDHTIVVFTPFVPNTILGRFDRIDAGGYATDGFSINDLGQISATRTDALFQTEGFLYTPQLFRAPVITSLGGLYGFGLNNRGQVAGPTLTGPQLWTPSSPNGTTGTAVDIVGAGPTAAAFFVDERGRVSGTIIDLGDGTGAGYVYTP